MEEKDIDKHFEKLNEVLDAMEQNLELRENILKDLKSTSLEIRLNVLNDMMLQSVLIDMGYIPDGFWSDEKEKKYGSFHKFAKKFTKAQLKVIKEWQKDGSSE